MQLLATGKWSKAEKRWKMLVALHRPTGGCAPTATARGPRDRNSAAPARVVHLADRR